jgi:hypothetical protein
LPAILEADHLADELGDHRPVRPHLPRAPARPIEPSFGGELADPAIQQYECAEPRR